MRVGLRLTISACLVMAFTVGGTWLAFGQPAEQPAAPKTAPAPSTGNGKPAPADSEAPPRSPLLRALYEAIDKIEDPDNQFGDRGQLKQNLRDADGTLGRIRRDNARALASVGRQTPLASQPNLIVITLDDLPWEHLGCYGQKAIQTPNLDRLATRGARFTNFRAGAGDAASKWTLLTGRPIKAGDPFRLAPGEVTVAQTLWRAGYATAWFGDVSLGDANDSLDPAELGFDFWFGVRDPAIAYFPQRVWRLGQAVDVAENQDGKNGRFVNDLYTEQAASWVRGLNAGNRQRPFFMMVSYRAPAQQWQAPLVESYAQATWSDSAKTWASMVTGIDRGVGQLLVALRESNQLGNTIILITADQRRAVVEGDEAFAVEGAAAEDPQAAEQGPRVPLIIWGAGRVASKLVGSEPASMDDLAPTLAGLASYSKGRVNYQGQSLGNQLNPAPQPVETKVVGEGSPTGPQAKPKSKPKLPEIIRGRPQR